MDERASKPNGAEPVVDAGRRCGKCGYNLTGLNAPIRCPECAYLWPDSNIVAGNIKLRKRQLALLNVSIVGIVLLMLLVPQGGGMMILVPPAGIVFRLLLFPLQWIFAIITFRVASRATGPPELDRYVLWIGFVLPLIMVGLTLFFGGQIMRFEGLFQLLFG